MSTPAQLPLDLPHRPALGREDFLVAEANQTAVAWIDLWPGWPQPALVLHGPPGSGKTHLGQVWRHSSGAAQPDAARLLADDPPDLLGDGTDLLLDDADRVVGQARDRDVVERRLLHLYNVVRERGGHLLLTARGAPARWDVRLPDLRSRLRAATCAETWGAGRSVDPGGADQAVRRPAAARAAGGRALPAAAHGTLVRRG